MAASIILGVITIACIIYTIMAFCQKGPILTPRYFTANKEDRKKLKTKSEYYFIAIIFVGVTVLCAALFFNMLFNVMWLVRIAIGVAIAMVIFAVIVSVRADIKAQKKKQQQKKSHWPEDV